MYEGGTSAAPVPQAAGASPIAYVRTPPDRAKSTFGQDLVVGFPLTLRPVGIR